MLVAISDLTVLGAKDTDELAKNDVRQIHVGLAIGLPCFRIYLNRFNTPLLQKLG